MGCIQCVVLLSYLALGPVMRGLLWGEALLIIEASKAVALTAGDRAPIQWQSSWLSACFEFLCSSWKMKRPCVRNCSLVDSC